MIDLRSKAGVSALALALAGCVSVLPEPSTPDALYRIEARADGPALYASLEIREPEAPRLMAGAALVSEDFSGALRLIPGAEWAGPATRQIQLAVVDSFTLGEGGAAVLPESGVRTEYQLNSRVQTFGLVRDVAICELSANLIHAGDRKLIAQSKVLAERQPTSLKADDRAIALKAAAEECVAEMARFAVSALPSQP